MYNITMQVLMPWTGKHHRTGANEIVDISEREGLAFIAEKLW